MLVNLKGILEESTGGIASFNCVDLEMARGCLDAAEASGRPVIIGVATRHWEVLGGKLFVPSLLSVCNSASVPVVLHLDHAKPSEVDIIQEALDSGFTSIMIDASKQSFTENVEITARVVSLAARYSAGTEAELGPILGDEGVAGVVDSGRSSVFTDPVEAARFCSETGIDALAVAVGTAHGLYKETPRLRQEIISEIAGKTDTPLVLHGATGIPDEAVREAVRRGIRKINFFSGLLVSAMDEVRNAASEGNNDYVALRQAMKNSWKITAEQMIRLYNG